MNDLISRKEVKAIANTFTFTDKTQERQYMDFLNYCLDNAPTVEARPVVHGEWIDKGWDGDFSWKIDGRGNCWKVEECSACGYKLCGSAKTNFCPECGAMMSDM